MLFLLVSLGLFTSFKPQTKTWVAIGDSITYLNDHPEETGSRITKGYMSRVAAHVPGLSFINQGHNGWTAGGIADHIEQLGIVKADIYSVFLGTNDWWAGRPVGQLSDYLNGTGSATLYGAYRIIVNKIRSLNKEARVILITPMQRVDFVYINDQHNNAWGSYKEKDGQSLLQFAEAVKVIAKHEKFDLIDLYHQKGMQLKDLVKYKRVKDPLTGTYKNYSYPDFIGLPFNADTDEYPYPEKAAGITYDGLHPSDNGYAIISRLLLKVMNK